MQHSINQYISKDLFNPAATLIPLPKLPTALFLIIMHPEYIWGIHIITFPKLLILTKKGECGVPLESRHQNYLQFVSECWVYLHMCKASNFQQDRIEPCTQRGKRAYCMCCIKSLRNVLVSVLPSKLVAWKVIEVRCEWTECQEWFKVIWNRNIPKQ